MGRHLSKTCPHCATSLYGKTANVYITTRKDGREQRQCKPCKLRQVAERHQHRMNTDPVYAEKQYAKFMAFHEARRQFAIKRWKAQHA